MAKEPLDKRIAKLPRGRKYPTWLDNLPEEDRKQLNAVKAAYTAGEYKGISAKQIYETVMEALPIAAIGWNGFRAWLVAPTHGEKTNR